MTFDNSRTIIAGRIRLFAATVLLLAYLALAYVGSVIRFPVMGISDTLLTVVLVVIYLLIVLYPIIMDHQYISYSDDDEKITVRYLDAVFAGGKKKSVEIPKSGFAGYRVDRKFFGLIISITLFQQLPQGVARYPAICINNLTKKERAVILNSLFQHTPHDAEEVKK
ncbi:MAG TPA: hypothetical protein VMT63_01060 [Bacteroidales bacterium]|nr:hypothetical protein [Bacteroidales bacterium]